MLQAITGAKSIDAAFFFSRRKKKTAQLAIKLLTVPLSLAGILFILHTGTAYAAYGDWDSSVPAWLDQSLTSANGDFILRFSDDSHHFSGYSPTDTDGDGLPDAFETDFFGDLSRNGGGDFDGDGRSDLQEFQAGSWPDDDHFRPGDTVPSATNAAGNNLVIGDSVNTLLFCQSKYAQWGFAPPWGLPLGVYVRWGDGGGWGSVNPLWIAPSLIQNLNNPDRRAVTIHELFHNIQKSYPDTPSASDWFIEGSARMSQDFFYQDMDVNDLSNYSGEVQGFLASPEGAGLFNRSYNAAFFWKYLCEQTGKRFAGMPWIIS